MHKLFTEPIKIFLLIFVLAIVAACIHTSPVPRRTVVSPPDSTSSRASIPEEVVRNNEPQNNLKHPVSNVSIPKPLGLDDIEYYLKNKVSSKLIVSRILERGVSFELTDKVKKRLKKVKADERVFKAIYDAKSNKKLP